METRGNVIINGFTVVPIKFDENSKASHVLYIKQHSLHRDDSKTKKRTLFITNIPPYCTKEALHRIFAEFGQVQNVFLSVEEYKNSRQKKPSTSYFPQVKTSIKGFNMGYVIYTDKASVAKALKAESDKPFIISTKSNPVLTGMSKWQKQYNVDKVDASLLQSEIDEFMETFDNRLNQQIEKEKTQEGIADDEGWVTVTKHGKMRPTPRTEINQKKLTKKDRKKRQEKELLNFYTFQIKQEKQDRIANLRQRFEEDKERIAQMKAARKFKPY